MPETNPASTSWVVTEFRRWEIWLLLTLFSGFVWFAINDRARIASLAEATRTRQIINEERITKLEVQFMSMQDNYREIKEQQKVINDKLDVIRIEIRKIQ